MRSGGLQMGSEGCAAVRHVQPYHKTWMVSWLTIFSIAARLQYLKTGVDDVGGWKGEDEHAVDEVLLA